MTIRTVLFEAQRLIGKRLQGGTHDREMLLCASSALFFIADTGQHYRFEDYRKSPAPVSVPSSVASGLENLKRQTEEYFVHLRDSASSSEENVLSSVVIDVLNFIATSGQYTQWEEFRDSARGGLPRISASFRTREEAEEWLDNQSEPPSQGYVLVGDDYLQFYYFRESDQRGLRQDFSLEYFIKHLTEKQLPPAVASFGTQEEAEAWLANEAMLPEYALVEIAGEHHLVVYHANINHRAIYPLSVVKRLERWEQSS